jgi:putative salt-induced outer membrane protein
MQVKKTVVTVSVLLSTCFAKLAYSQDKPDGAFHGTASLGASYSSGAVSTTTFTAAFDTARKTGADKLGVTGLASRGSTKTDGDGRVTTTDLYRLGARYDRDFNKQLFGYLSGELERNGVTDLDLRAGSYLGLGYHAIATPQTTFDLFAGVGYNHYDFKTRKEGSGEAMIGEESAHKLSETTTFKQKLVIYPAFDSDLGYRAQWDATLGVAMGGGWNLNVSGTAKYANKVFVAKKAETLLTVGVGYKF